METYYSVRSNSYLFVDENVLTLVPFIIILDCNLLSVGLSQCAFFQETLMKFPLEYVSRGKQNSSLSVHLLIIHTVIGDIPYRGMRICDRVPSPVTNSLSVLVGIHSEI
jgi:hypothetical protein